jgi:predicted transcriptional regulator
LKTWRIDEDGSYIDRVPLSGVRISELGIQEGDYFTLRVGVVSSAQHVGGMNLFGASFGDYPQHILLKYAYH